MVSPVLLAAAGSVLVLGSWVGYMATVPSGRVPVLPWGHFALQGAGTALALLGVVFGGDSLVVFAVAAPALIMAALFAWLYSQRATPAGRLRVTEGQPLRPFTATTSEGAAFDTAALAGRRVLLKFFRGHW